MTEETVLVPLTSLDLLLERYILADGKPDHAKLLKKIRPIVDVRSRARPRAAVNMSGIALDLDSFSPADALGRIQIGDVFEIYANGAAGANADGNVYSLLQKMSFKVHYATLRLQNAAVAGNRTMTLNYTGTIIQRSWTVAHPDFASTTSGAVIVSQYGGIIELPNGVEQTNINGTITTVVGRSPFPVQANPFFAGTLRLTSVIANIQAGDLVTVSALIERVA